MLRWWGAGATGGVQITPGVRLQSLMVCLFTHLYRNRRPVVGEVIVMAWAGANPFRRVKFPNDHDDDTPPSQGIAWSSNHDAFDFCSHVIVSAHPSGATLDVSVSTPRQLFTPTFRFYCPRLANPTVLFTTPLPNQPFPSVDPPSSLHTATARYWRSSDTSVCSRAPGSSPAEKT